MSVEREAQAKETSMICLCFHVTREHLDGAFPSTLAFGVKLTGRAGMGKLDPFAGLVKCTRSTFIRHDWHLLINIDGKYRNLIGGCNATHLVVPHSVLSQGILLLYPFAYICTHFCIAHLNNKPVLEIRVVDLFSVHLLQSPQYPYLQLLEP